MNIATMQLTNSKMNLKSVSTTSSNNTITTFKSNANKFNKVFNDTLSSSRQQSTKEANSFDTVDQGKVEELLNSDSIEEVLDQLDIPHDEDLLMLPSDEDGQAIAMDELMNLDSLLAILNIDGEQLLKNLEELTETSSLEGNDLWAIIQNALENEPALIEQLTAALAGEGKVTPKEAEQVLQFLKLAQTAGPKSDLLYSQSNTLDQLKELIQTMANEINKSQPAASKLARRPDGRPFLRFPGSEPQGFALPHRSVP